MTKRWIAVLRAADAPRGGMFTSNEKALRRRPTSTTCWKLPRLLRRRPRERIPTSSSPRSCMIPVEDQEVPREIMARTFGEEVAKLVERLPTTSRSISESANGFRLRRRVEDPIVPKF